MWIPLSEGQRAIAPLFLFLFFSVSLQVALVPVLSRSLLLGIPPSCNISFPQFTP
ncbi:hypothetical protein P170DRAFT_432418 [Aspergillus steynii IBT 23096]|uniref:Uncharacterized protein n=1 Tax=Aspergillus steynii IBT 23096 TaxID=1392250 RepID=A0A2I2GPP0_9EURO|nr:uncharacterized protein P170DRAFT_432418 [Aspergillus steynii IBT 23096]PLB54844.1 hypothetical protein P170DRAFT_432418 [Aspergillus steynii IBT 23096]